MNTYLNAESILDGSISQSKLDSNLNALVNKTLTEQDIAAMGFTKNTGTYSKPATGIPKTDLASDVQASLEKADTALQSVPSEYMTAEEVGTSFVKKGTYIMPNNGFDDSSMNTFGLSFLSNALYAADKRFDVQLSGCSSGTAANLFNGSYEDPVGIDAGTTGVITIANNGASIIDGYPYGEIYVSFYYENTPQDVTVRAYCNFEEHGIGWKTLPLSQLRGQQNGVYVFSQGYYNITELEITVTAKSDTPTRIVQLDWNLSRAALTNYAAVTKFGLEQELFGKYKFADAIALGGRAISSWDDLGYATSEQLSSKQDALVSGTNIKTINGESILGEGNLNIESNNGSAVVVHDASETEVELTPNVIHKWDGATSISLTVPEDPDGMVYSYKAVFAVASSAFSLSLPYNLRWVNSTMPAFEYGKQYEISIEGGRVLWAMFDEPAIEGKELPWIENDGTDYILTDYYPDENDVKQSVKFSVLETLTHHQCIVGTSEGSTLSTTKIAIWALSDNGNILQYFDTINTKLSSSTTVGQVYEFSGESTAATKLNASRPLTVFNLNSSGGVTSTNAAHARFYYFRLYDASGKVTLDLRPFKRTSDGAIGVLDAVSGTFYPSVNGNLTEGA